MKIIHTWIKMIKTIHTWIKKWLYIFIIFYTFAFLVLFIKFVWDIFPEYHQKFIDNIITLVPLIVITLIPLMYKVFSDIKKKEQDIEKQEHERQNWILRNREAFLIDLIDTLISQTDLEKEMTDKELLDRIKNIQPALIAHGSGGTLKAWQDLQNENDITDDAAENIKHQERFLRAIRKDLGHNDRKMPPGAILATIIKTGERQAVYDACKEEKYD